MTFAKLWGWLADGKKANLANQLGDTFADLMAITIIPHENSQLFLLRADGCMAQLDSNEQDST